MGSGYLMDSNAIIDFLSGAVAKDKFDLLCSIVNQTPRLSVISQIEILSGKSDSFNEIASKFIDDAHVYPLSESIIKRTIEIRKKYRLKTPDAIIAAMALDNNFVLVTSDFSGFQNIKGLKLINHK